MSPSRDKTGLERNAVSADNLKRRPSGLKKILIVDDTPQGVAALRGIVDAGALFAPDAVVEMSPFVQRHTY